MPVSSPFCRPRYRLGFALVALLLGLAAHAQTASPRVLRNTGPNANRVNVAILGDGFTAAQQDQFFAAAQAKLAVLVNNESFAASRDLINGVAVFTASNESGTDLFNGTQRDTYYDTAFTSDRLLHIPGNEGQKRARDILRQYAPDYDISIVLVNTTVYGGAGGSLTTASLNAASDNILLHEIGHSFALLADEYVDADAIPFYATAEFPNATQKTARAELAWADFILDSTPVPTPIPAPASNTDVNLVGHWTGAHYRSTGFYRPVYDSAMRTLGRPFGPVNLRAFAAALHRVNLNSATTPPTRLAIVVPTASVPLAGRLSLVASAEGHGPFTYQWIRNGKFIAGQTEATLTIASIEAAYVGNYGVEITNAAGAASSLALGVSARIEARGTGAAATFEATVGTQAVVRWAKTALFVAEESGVVALTVSRAGPAVEAHSVPYATASGTATAPADFTAQSGTVSWAGGDRADKTIVISVARDTLAEPLETFTVTLGTPSAGVIAGNAVVTVTLADSGTRDPTFTAEALDNSVLRILPAADGSVIMAGHFTALQDALFAIHELGRIARLKPDGFFDPSFRSAVGANNSIYALARQADGKILIGGDFTSYDGTPRSRIARLEANGALDPTFDPGGGADRAVYDLQVLSDGKILVAGSFTAFNSAPREYLVRLNADGSVDPSFTGPDFAGTTGFFTRALAPLPDGRVLVGGAFAFSGANQRSGLCRLNANGSIDATFNGIVQGAFAAATSNVLGELRQVGVQPDGKIVICGALGLYNQVVRRGIARLTANGALDSTFDPGTGANQPVDTFLLQPDGKVIIGGRFTSFNGPFANRLARLHADGSVDTAFAAGNGFTQSVNTLVAQADGHVLVGANVATFQDSPVSRPIWRFLSGTAGTVVTTPTGSQVPVDSVSPVNPGRLVNLSVRADLTSASDTFTFGVVVGGAGTTGPKALLVRAAGPSLAAFGLSGVLADPKLEFYSGTTKVGENNDWGGSAAVSAAMAGVGAFAFSGPASRDAALALPTVATGSNSAIISGTDAGTVIAELYDATPPASFTAATPRLINVSVLKHLGTGVIAGFVIGGTTARTVLIRAIGPTLGAAPFNVGGVVADPQLALFSDANQIGGNDNWGGGSTLSAAFTGVGAFALPAASRDAALVSTLPPGSYTVQVSGVGNTTGVGLIEIYEAP